MSQWSLEVRAKSLINRSSIVTQALKLNEDRVGLESYRELQALESEAVAAGAVFDGARAALQAAKVKRGEAARALSAINWACLVICKVRGLTAALYGELDRGDPTGLAKHLEAPVSRVETTGPMMAKLLREQRKILGKCSQAVEPEITSITRAQEELSSVLYKLEAGIARGRALLARKGVSVKFPTKPRTSNGARSSPEAGAVPGEGTPGSTTIGPGPQLPANGASGPVKPVTAGPATDAVRPAA